MTEREELVEAMAKLVFEAVNPTYSWSVYKGSRTKGEFCAGMSAALDEAVKRLGSARYSAVEDPAVRAATRSVTRILRRLAACS